MNKNMRKIKAELSTDGVHRYAVTITAELIAAQADYGALVAACQAALDAFEAGEPDAWRWVAGAVPRLPRRLPARVALERNAELLTELTRVDLAYWALVAACWAGLRAGFDAQSPLADLGAWRHIADELDGETDTGIAGGGARG